MINNPSENTPAAATASQDKKPSAKKIVLWTILFQLAWHFRLIIPFMQEGSFKDPDDFLRLHQIRNWMGGQGWFDVSVPRMNLPDGGDMHWSRLVDVPMAGLIWFFDLFTDTVIAERLTAIFWPLILVIACVFTLISVCERLFPPTNRLVALLFVVTCITSLAEFAPGRIDHHGVQILLYCLTLLGLVNADRWFGHYLVGACVAFSIVIGLDVVLLLVFILAWLGVEWVFDLDKGGKGLMRTGLALTATSFLLYPIVISQANWFIEVCDAISIVYLSAILLISVSFTGLSLLTKTLTFENILITRLSRLGAGTAFAMISISMLYIGYPKCSAGPMSGISTELKEEWLSDIVEAKGLITYIREFEPSTIGIPIYLLIIVGGGALLMYKGKTSPRFIAIWASLVISFLLGFIQIRAYRIGMFATVPICVMIAHYFWDYATRRFGGKTPMAYITIAIIGVLMLSPTWQVIGSALALPFGEDQKIAAAKSNMVNDEDSETEPVLCNRQSDYGFMNTLPKGNVMNDINSGPAILVFTEHDVTAGNYHRNGEAILDVRRFFASEDAKALEIIKRRNSDYVMMCNIELDPIDYPISSELIGARILRGDLPDWLERLSPDGDDVLVYRFVQPTG